jgi:hypothetical protein
MLLAGAAAGLALQRSQLCFNSALRNVFGRRERGVAGGLLAALAAGSVGYSVVYLAQLPDPTRYLPETAHIAPASFAVLVGGLLFGFGMILGGGCVSGHLFRMGEGSLIAPVGLLGVLPGYMLGLAFWNFLYVKLIAAAPVVWLPKSLGYAGALIVQLLLLAGLAALLSAKTAPPPPRETEPATPAGTLRQVFVRRWPAWTGGVLLGLVGTFTLLITEPLGVTGPFGRWGRQLGDAIGLLPPRLEGLDRMAGCRAVMGASVLSPPLLLVIGLFGGSLFSSLLAGEFRLKGGTPGAFARAAAGGILVGLGASMSLGCTVGTLLSGIMAYSLHGWVFLAGLLAGAGVAVRVLVKTAPPRAAAPCGEPAA